MSREWLKQNAPSHTARGNGAGLMPGAPSEVGGPGGEGASDTPYLSPSLQVFPWWYYPPEGSSYFYVDAPNQVVAAGVQNQVLTDSIFRVRDGQRAVITSIALVVQLPTATDDFFYTMRRNNGPVQGMDRLRNFALPANAAVRDLNGYTIRLQPGDEISWTVTNNGVAAVTVGVSYIGWNTMVTDIERVSQGIKY